MFLVPCDSVAEGSCGRVRIWMVRVNFEGASRGARPVPASSGKEEGVIILRLVLQVAS